MASDSETSSQGDFASPVALKQIKRKIVLDREDEDSRTGSEDYGGGELNYHTDKSDRYKSKSKRKKGRNSYSEDDSAADSNTGGLQDPRGNRMKSRRKDETDESSVEEELRDLLDDEIGENQVGRIKSKASVSATNDISRIFEDEENYDEAEDSLKVRDHDFLRKYANNEEDQDDMDDFITDDEVSRDESSESSEFSRPPREAPEVKRKGEVISSRHSLISENTWRDINCLFGNGSDYAWALYSKNPEEYESKGISSQYADSDKPSKDVKLDDIYEAQEIEKNMLTEQDDIIRSVDVPERFQIEDVVVDSSKKLDYQSMVNFVYNDLLEDNNEIHRLGKIPYSNLTNSISKVLKYIHISAFEVPYIYYYRRDYLHPDLTLTDLWNIYDSDIKYNFYQKRKTNLKSLYDSLISEIGIQPDEPFEQFFASCETKEQVEDLYSYLNFKYCKEVNNIEDKNRVSFKKVPRLGLHELSKRAGINELAKLFNVNVPDVTSAFTQNVDSEYPISHKEMPEECAKRYICDELPTVEEVLNGARQIIIHEFASYPRFRAFVRGFTLLKASVTVNFTPRGVQNIDAAHPYYNLKYVTDKNLSKFVDGQFAQIISAENEGLLTIEIKIEDKDSLVKNLRDRLQGGSESETVSAWDGQRAIIAEKTFNTVLFPEMCKFIRRKLLSKANAWIVRKCEKVFEERINMAPYDRDNSENTTRTPRVIAASWGDGGADDPTYFVALKKTGEVHNWKTIYRFRKVHLDTTSSEFQELIEFINGHNPAVVVIAGFRPNLKTQLFNYMVELIRTGNESGKLEKIIPVFIVYDEFSRMYMTSDISLNEFPEPTYSPLFRYCVSLGRYVQNPVAEASRLFNQSNDIAGLNVSDLQHLVPMNNLLRAYERAFVNVVSMCGVDINNAVKYEHASSVLQFVPGLGMRKAQALLSKLKLNRLLRSRTDLIRRKLCAANVFMNCAAFLRIRSKYFKNDPDNAFDILDDTRIHPEDYDLARKMAVDALDIDEFILDYEENQSQHVKELIESKKSEKLSQLALDEFAVELEKRINEKKRLVLHDIVNELLCPFKEKRLPFRPATPEQIFIMVTDETPDALCEGLVIPVQITTVGERILRCKLACGIDSFLHVRNTKFTGVPLSEVFSEYETIQCKILKVDIDRLQIELSLRDVNTFRADNRITKDDHVGNSRQMRNMGLAGNSYTDGTKPEHKRSINHPLFQNLDKQGALLFLFSKPQGSIVVYPSQKSNFFDISCKLSHNTYLNVEMEVTMRLNSDRSNETVFMIKGKGYSEIDQIIAEYIDPLARKILNIHHHSKFKNAEYSEMSSFLESQCKLTKRSCYGFIRDPKSLESILLVYRHVMGGVKSDIVTVTLDGYLFRKKIFRTIDEMLNFFKESEAAKSLEQQRQNRSRFSRDYRTSHAEYSVHANSTT